MNIFIAKLSSRTDDNSLRALFEPFGEIRSAKVIMDRETGFSKKFGFVEMDNDDEANMAIEQLNETDFEGSTIVVKKARPREDNRGGGGGGYRQGGGGFRGNNDGYRRNDGGGYRDGGRRNDGGYRKNDNYRRNDDHRGGRNKYEDDNSDY
jgi:RNA recognition motif-containing protein